jgi:magnesium transporter
MLGERNKILVEAIKRLLRRNAATRLQKLINKIHVADLSHIFRYFPFESQKKLFDMIRTNEQKGDFFNELDDDIFLNLAESLKIDYLVEIIEAMPSDDIADLIAKLPEKRADEILKKMQREGSEKVEALLDYKDDTAGGIMVPDFIALNKNITAKEAIVSLQKEYIDVEMPFYLYVVDDYESLIGIISLRQLVVIPPDTPLKAFMATDVISVLPDIDQEEVARLVARYDILAVPVVNENRKIVGIITVDDVIDIIREEATEDILKMAGAGEEFIETQSVIKSTRIRLPWLFASCIGGIIAFFIIGYFEENLAKFTFLAAFIPVIMGMGGNIGTQSSTIVVRGLATGRINFRDFWKIVSKELTVGVILGCVYGIIIGLVAHMSYHTITLGISVGLAVLSSMSLAALIGSMVPLLFVRINIDPAVATGPFVTTSIDIISVFLYFQIATNLLELNIG